MPYLELEQDGAISHFPLDDRPVEIGRSRRCALRLEDPQVSRVHARIFRRGERFVLEDAGSRHGTVVNGKTISTPIYLYDGDEILLHSRSLRYRGGKLPLPEASTTEVVTLVGAEPVILSTQSASTSAASVRVEVRSEVKLRALLEILDCLRGSVRVQELLPRILERLRRIFPQATKGFILLLDREGGGLRPVASWGAEGGAMPISRTIVDRALKEKRAILFSEIDNRSAVGASASVAALGIRAMLCAPLLATSGEPLGILQVHSEDPSRSFFEEDLDLLVSVATTIAMAVENARLAEESASKERVLREVELAHDVQQSFLPLREPEVPGYRFFAFYQSARVVGGDYYGYQSLPDGRLAIAVADVSGKGMPAAMVMARLSGDVRQAVLTGADAGAALGVLHRSLAESNMNEHFVTLVLFYLDHEQHRLEMACAGHPSPLVRRADGSLDEFGAEVRGLPLNASPEADCEYQSASMDLDEGTSVLVYTDGISEARRPDGRELGAGFLRDLFLSAPAGPDAAGARIVEAVTAETRGAEQHDDMTLLCFGRASAGRGAGNGPPHGAGA